MLGVIVTPVLNGVKNAYYLKMANNNESEILFSIFHNNIVTPKFFKSIKYF